MTKLIVFDFDGTLGNTLANILVTMRRITRQLGYPDASDEAIKTTIGLPLEVGIRQLYPQADDSAVQRATILYREVFEQTSKEIIPTVFPHVPETLAALAGQGVVMTVASAREEKSLRQLLQRMGLDAFFPYVLGANNVTRNKPDPEPVLKTMSELGFSPEDTLVVGDMPVDVLMGKRAGARACAVTYGNSTRAELLEAGADKVIDDFSQLLSIL